jgi:hypothetical protein
MPDHVQWCEGMRLTSGKRSVILNFIRGRMKWIDAVCEAECVVFEGCSVDGGNLGLLVLHCVGWLRKREGEWVVHNLFYDVLL